MKKIALVLINVILSSFLYAQSYTFNAKATFRASSKEGTIQSYFYLNTKNGNVGQDTKAWQMMAQENADVMIFSLVEYGKKMTQYLRVEGKKHKVQMPLSKENYTATEFWKQFKKTGRKNTFGKYKAQEYTGKVDGKTLSIWLGEKTYNLDGKLQGDIIGFFGLGYLHNPNENVYYLLVHFKDSDAEVTLLDITPFNYSFNGNGYEGMNMGAGLNANQTQNPTRNFKKIPIAKFIRMKTR